MVQAARGGTLVLNEVEAVPIGQQAVLLDLIESKVIRAVGSAEAEPVDVRIIATTNADMGRANRDQTFRSDLLFRLRRLSFHLPPLRERLAQLPDLAAYLLAREWADVAPGGDASPPELTPSALAALRAHAWPGNVRELSAVLFRAMLMVHLQGKRVLNGNLVAQVLREHSAGMDDRTDARPSGRDGSGIRYVAPGDPEEESRRIQEALRAEAGNQTRAAQRLGMSRTTLWERMRRYGLDVTPVADGLSVPQEARTPPGTQEEVEQGG